VKIDAWQKKDYDAREADRQALHELMDQLETNQQQIFNALSKMHMKARLWAI
jgi:hypothetical protein